MGIRSLRWIILVLISSPAWAVNPREPIHWSGDKTLWNRNLNKVELIGHARVHQEGESLTADYIQLDLERRTIDAKGNVVYYSTDTVVFSEELHFNLDTNAGSIVSGKITNGNFLLMGERINRLSKMRFQTHNAEYTTCIDCPAGWTMFAEDVDMEIEGYAYLSNVTTKVKDAPVLWMPYLIIPIKTNRQTGFLFPKISRSEDHGEMLVLPFFWASTRSTDMTLGLGTYDARGPRVEWEGRYAFGPKSRATIQYYHQTDTKNDIKREARPGEENLTVDQLNVSGFNRRYAFLADQEQILPFDITEKARVTLVSDAFYPRKFDRDFSLIGDPTPKNETALPAELILYRESSSVGVFAQGKVLRNMVEFTDPTGGDDRTVQLLPKAQADVLNRPFFSSGIKAGLTTALSRFTRRGGNFDFDCEVDETCGSSGFRNPSPGKDPIRKADRLTLKPRVYTSVRPGDVFSVVPAVEYRSHFYSFPQGSKTGDLARGFLLSSVDTSFQLERIYHTNDPKIPRVKHLIRPQLTYSRILTRNEDREHPFVQQVQRREGYQFDSEDIVPLNSAESFQNYFSPLGHSLTYGVTTQLVRRIEEKPDSGVFQFRRAVELNINQTLDILEFQKSTDKRVPFSRLESNLLLEYEKWSSHSEYHYYPYLGKLVRRVTARNNTVVADPSPHEFSTSFAYTFIDKRHRDLYEFKRQISLGYNYRRLDKEGASISLGATYSFSDYFMTKASLRYNLFKTDTGLKRFDPIETSIIFQSPARCWKLSLNFRWTTEADKKFEYGGDLALNITGTGFGGVGEAAGSAGVQ